MFSSPDPEFAQAAIADVVSDLAPSHMIIRIDTNSTTTRSPNLNVILHKFVTELNEKRIKKVPYSVDGINEGFAPLQHCSRMTNYTLFCVQAERHSRTAFDICDHFSSKAYQTEDP